MGKQSDKAFGLYSSKAEKYDNYRWKYAPECINTILKITGISKESIIADIGAGTGIFTVELVEKVKKVYAIEPNQEMRAILAKKLEHNTVCQIIDGSAENTTLHDHSVNLVTVAQAIHWFDPIPAKQEIYRILKANGWIAICRNYGTDLKLGQAISEVYPAEKDTGGLIMIKSKPANFYYGGDDYIKREFAFRIRVGWDEFMGGLATASYAPDEGSNTYIKFEKRARYVFEQFNVDGFIEQNGITELFLGQIRS